VIAGKDKLSTYLGQKFKYIPIEVVPFAYVPVKQWIEKQHGGQCELRMSKFVNNLESTLMSFLRKKCGAEITDNNNYILDWHFPESSIETDWRSINTSIQCRPGVVETGLFIDVVNYTYLGSVQSFNYKRL
jgi:ribose 5-phosphate isomerase A